MPAPSPDVLIRVGSIGVAMVGLLLLLAAMVRFEQRRRGRFALLASGCFLVLGSVGAVTWSAMPA